ncbi:MAG: hypothetical protein KatS3mg129_1460 [Leptospiraceae bacterium]|nr:MAG: hypothetical protein KatS3mg129_1460 [Leptospiraceae bacterium]
MVRKMMKRKIIIFFLYLVFLFWKIPIFAQETLSNLLYDGDILLRSFFLSRDILTKKQILESCPNPVEVYENPSTTPNTKCKEKRDEHKIRFRLNLLFSPNAFTEVYYGLEVGDVTFGKEKNQNGPESGGSGSGATNIETRELRLSIHNQIKTTLFDIGIFPYSTPDGLVLATSGAGIKFRHEFKELNSLLETVYFKLQDNSFIDNDSNGFSDENYKDVELISTSYKIFRFSDVIPQFYFVYKRDPVEKDENNNPKDTFQYYWSGIYFQYSYKNWNIYFNLVNLQGYLLSETKIIENDSFLKTYFPDIYNIIQNQNNAFPKSRRKYPKNAYAGNLEISYRPLNDLKISYVLTGATGRAGLNNDGTVTDYNKDQYKSAGGSFQFSEIGVDTSGGYSLLNIDKLSGMIVSGIRSRISICTGYLY